MGGGDEANWAKNEKMARLKFKSSGRSPGSWFRAKIVFKGGGGGGHCHDIHFLKLKMLSINVRAGRD